MFVGNTLRALGDYCGDTSARRTPARFSPLGVYDFQKRTSVIQVSREGRITSDSRRRGGGQAPAPHLMGPPRTETKGRCEPDWDAWTVIRAVRAISHHVRGGCGLIEAGRHEKPSLPAKMCRNRGIGGGRQRSYPDPGASDLKARLREVMDVPDGMGCCGQ